MKKIDIVYVVFIFFTIAFAWKQASLYAQKPSSKIWKSVNSYLNSNDFKNDGILFNPGWLAGYATDMDRLKSLSLYDIKYFFKNDLITPSDIWIAELAINQRIHKKMKRKGFDYLFTKTIGNVSLSRFSKRAKLVSFDFVKEFTKAETTLETEAIQLEKGRLAGNKFVFKDHNYPWNDIREVSIKKNHGQGKIKAIWFHPLSNVVKTIRYSKIENSGGALLVEVGLADSGRRYDRNRPVKFEVIINNQSINEFRIDEEHSVQTSRISLEKFGNTIDVEFRVSAENSVDARHIYYQAQIISE